MKNHKSTSSFHFESVWNTDLLVHAVDVRWRPAPSPDSLPILMKHARHQQRPETHVYWEHWWGGGIQESGELPPLELFHCSLSLLDLMLWLIGCI